MNLTKITGYGSNVKVKVKQTVSSHFA